MAAYPIVRLGCVTIDPRQAHTYWSWAARNGLLPAACCTPPEDAGGCWADTPTTPYSDPTTDCAAWVDINYAESAEFLGVYLTSVQGLDDDVTSRAVVQNVDGGSTSTAPVISGRGIRLVGYLAASSCAGMEWGKQWFRRTLDEVCRWGGGTTSGGGCGTGIVSVRAFCPPNSGVATDGIRDLVNVSLANAPLYKPVDDIIEELACTCTRMQFEVTLVAGDPHLFRAPASVIARTAFAGALDYAALACTPVPVTIPAEIACLAVSVPPDADATLPEFDDYGRPSCGSGSAYYGSRAEAAFEDERGHPASGAGSAYYLRTPGELPALDWMGRPSCGSGSADYAKEPATTAIVSEQLYTTNTVAQWTKRTTSVAALTSVQAGGATFVWSGTGRVRDIKLRVIAANDYDPVPATVVNEVFYGGLQTLPVTKNSFSGARLGARYAVELTWEERIDTGQTITLVWSTGATSALAGPNAGSNRACAAQVNGPNSGVDRPARTECVSRLAALATTITPAGGSAGHQGNATAPAALIPFNQDEGDRFFGTLTSSGQAQADLAGFATSAVCAGSTVLWARLRVRFKTPSGVGTAGTPYPWTIEAYHGLVSFGGRSGSIEQFDGSQDVLFPLNVTQADLATLTVWVDLHGPIGGTEGWIEYLALEVEYVGAPACRDCGVNGGADVPCAATPASGCYTRPATVALATGRYVTPTVAGAAPVITVEAGAAALSNVAVFAWADPVNRTAPTVDQASFDFWRCVTPCMSGEIAWMPAGSTLTIDARSRTVTLSVNGISVEASRYLTGPGGTAWTWPVWSGPVRAAIVAPSTVDATARVTVTAAIAEGV